MVAVQLFHQPNTIEDRHTDVRQHHIGAVLVQPVKNFLPVFTQGHHFKAQCLPGQTVGHTVANGLLIVSNHQTVHSKAPPPSFTCL